MFFVKYILLTILIIALLVFAACSSPEKAPIGSRENPIRILFTPSVDAEKVLSEAKVFVELLNKQSGLHFESAVPSSYIVVVEAFGTKRCDVACMNSFGYLLANEKYGAEARLRILRNGEAFYRGEIIARRDSGIRDLRGIDKKRIAFTDPASTSGYLLPLKLLTQYNIAPSDQVFAMRHDNVVAMVYQGKVDAGACFYSPPDEFGDIRDARARVSTQFPDVQEKISIIALTEPIPNDPIVFRKDIPASVKSKIEDAFVRVLATAEGKKAFYTLYSADGVTAASDKDYDPLRALQKHSGKTSAQFLRN